MKRLPREDFQFHLGANRWTVKWSDTLLEEQGCYGITHYDTNTIILQRPIKGKYKQQNVVQVWWHEFYHAAFMTLNYAKLARDEKLVDQMGHATAQFIKTVETIQ